MLKRLLRSQRLRGYLQSLGHESMDAEDLRICQIAFAGRKARPVNVIKIATLSGGMALWGTHMAKDARKLIQNTANGYSLADALPFYLDFPIDPPNAPVPRFERYFCLILLGSRIGIFPAGHAGAEAKG